MERHIERTSGSSDVRRQITQQEVVSWNSNAFFIKKLDSVTAGKLDQKEEEVFRIVKEIPKALFESLYYNNGTSKIGNILCKTRENTTRFAQLYSLNEFVKILRTEALSSNDTPVSNDYDKGDIGCILLHTNDILATSKNNIQEVTEFHNHIKSKLAELGFESPAQ